MNTPVVVGDSGFMIFLKFFFCLYDGYRYTRFCGNISAINNIFSFSVFYDIPGVSICIGRARSRQVPIRHHRDIVLALL
jgi:hypothetical protein